MIGTGSYRRAAVAHNNDMIALAGFNLLDVLLVELEKSHPGIKQRVLDGARATTAADAARNPGGNSPAILAVLHDLR
jgi:hypothetical protein